MVATTKGLENCEKEIQNIGLRDMYLPPHKTLEPMLWKFSKKSLDILGLLIVRQ